MITTLSLLMTTCLSFGSVNYKNDVNTPTVLEDNSVLVNLKQKRYNREMYNYGEVDYVYSPEIKSTMINGGDAYEQNNLRETATRMSPLNHYEYDSYSAHVYANLESFSGILLLPLKLKSIIFWLKVIIISTWTSSIT